ncbi:MAG: UDP-N-acetylmuramate dehydrogenase [Candidatus Vogelbacteria bacterium]|nr:UDP-N-acetylmuramate dehydrogenase [Candidatus Vogelbacteria bacterium]
MKIKLPKKAKRNVNLADYTYFGLPGKAAYLVETCRPEELTAAIQAARTAKQKYFIIAGGSNIVTTDKMYDGVVIVYRYPSPCVIPVKTGIQDSPIVIQKNKLEVWASVQLKDVVKFALENGLAGLEYLSGIPGALAGAVYGNAGAYGHSISEAVEKVRIFDGKKERWLAKKDCSFSYRDSIFKKKNWAILSVVLKLRPGNREKLRAQSEKITTARDEKYSNIKCPGSFFRNVLVKGVSKSALAKVDKKKIIDGKIPAGFLLEEVGAKGMRIGGLYIADYHGNLLINDGTATYKDVQKLVAILKEKVKARFGIKLEEEVRYLI